MTTSGNTLVLDKSIADLERVLLEKPGDTRAARKLLMFLDRYLPRKDGFGAYTECQRMLRIRYSEEMWIGDILNPVAAAKHYKEWQMFVDSKCQIPPLAISQLFDGRDFTIDGVNTNCDMRLLLFERKNVISRLCHECYKVQVLPLDLKSLMQVHFILRRIELPRDNFRKCMIELREDITYPYKGYIFCESEEEVKNCFGKLEYMLREAGISNVYCGISHGCSEYGLKYPEFKYSHDGAHRSFARPAFWDQVESEFWSVTPDPTLAGKGRKKVGLSIRDIIGYRTWIDYAEIIGDESWRLFREAPSANKPPSFAERVKNQSQLRNAQLKELRERLLSAV